MRKTLAIVTGLVVGVAVFFWWPDPSISPLAIDTAITTSGGTTSTSAATPTTPASVCEPRLLGDDLQLAMPGTAHLEHLVSQLGCIPSLVIADSRDPYAVRTAEQLALEHGGVMLLWPGGDLFHELTTRVEPALVTTVGSGPRGVVSGARSVPPSAGPNHVGEVNGSAGVLVLDSSLSPAEAAAYRAFARTTGSAAVFGDTSDLRSFSKISRDLMAGAAGPVVLVGPTEDDQAAWQLDVVKAGIELPGGGQLLLPGRRIVALYGSPGYPSLGVLGEQDPAGAVDRVREVAQGYDADGTPVLHAFEIITTIASAGPGADGDYSAELSLDEIRPLIEEAGRSDVYVILDLQPGRTDFLTQAKIYEEFLRLPHVGLALDPEWRLGPSQVHLRQIGTVDAAEINTVVEWLAGIVREDSLPQKLLLLHQFKISMITNRDQVLTPPELAVVIQMDGQGPLGSKYGTWEALKNAGPNSGWMWGWKNFYDEDSPTATPEQVLALDPVPVLVSFQ